MRNEDAVLAANELFYHAFRARDIDAMDALWAGDTGVTCIHPGWNPLHSRDDVIDSWTDILDNEGAPQVSADNASAFVNGDMAFVVCNENLPGGVLAATNIFVREAGEWRICHHHAAPISNPAPTRDLSPGVLN